MAECIYCGHELFWSSSSCSSEVSADIPEDDTSTTDYYDCPYCGASYEIMECPDEEKENYDYWKNNLNNNTMTIEQLKMANNMVEKMNQCNKTLEKIEKIRNNSYIGKTAVLDLVDDVCNLDDGARQSIIDFCFRLVDEIEKDKSELNANLKARFQAL